MYENTAYTGLIPVKLATRNNKCISKTHMR